MHTRKVLPLLALLLPALAFSLPAQNAGDEIPSEPDWIAEDLSLYSPGSKVFAMSVGTLFPALAQDENGAAYGSSATFAGNLELGGTGSLAFFWFFTRGWFLGGELQGMFASTYGENMLYLVPVSLRGGYQFLIGRFEIPLSLGVGMYAASMGQDNNYIGLFLKGEASFFWRFHNEWSIGINGAWWFLPQWPLDRENHPEYDRYLHFIETTLAVRFHF